MTVLVVVLGLLIVLGLVVLVRGIRSVYQKYDSDEKLRHSNKVARNASFDRLRICERVLLEVQREAVANGEHGTALSIERRLSKLRSIADRLRYGRYGYTPVAALDPIHQDELAALQEGDADAMIDAQALIVQVQALQEMISVDGEPPDLSAIDATIDRLESHLSRRDTTR